MFEEKEGEGEKGERGIEEEKGVERGKEGRRKKCNTKAWRHKVEHFYENQLAVATVQYTD